MKRIVSCLLALALVGCGAPSGTPDADKTTDPGKSSSRPAPPPIDAPDAAAVERTEALLTELFEAKRFDPERVKTAHDEFKSIVEANPQLFTAHLALVETAAGLNRLRELEPWYLEHIKANPNTAGYYFGLARLQQARGAMGRNVPKTTPLNIALQLAPSEPEVLLLKADMLRFSRGLKAQQQRGEAMKAYRDVLAVDPDNARALYGLAVLEFDVRPSGPERAIGHLKRAIDLFRPWERGLKWEALMTLGGMHREMGQNLQALEPYREAEKVNFAATWARFDRAALLWQLGQHDRARQLWSEVRGKVMLGGPTGLKLFRHEHVLARGGAAYANLMPRGSINDYRTLITMFGTDRPRDTVAVPQAHMAVLRPGMPVYLEAQSGQLVALVQAHEKSRFGRELHLADSVISLLDDGKLVLQTETAFDHVLSIRFHDVDTDGSPEVLAAGLADVNALKLNVYRRTADGWRLHVQLSADCLTPSSGFVLADIDKAPGQEIVKVEGPDNWPTVYSLSEKGLVDISRNHGEFYDYFRAMHVPREQVYLKQLESGRGDARILQTVLVHIRQVKAWDKDK